MRVCIVGASGKLGHYMVQQSLDRGYEVVGVCRDQSVGKLDAFKGRITVIPGATDDREVIKRAVEGCDGVLVVMTPRGVHGYSTGTTQAVLDYAPSGARLVFSCGWHITRDGQDVYSWKLKTIVRVFGPLARLVRFADLDDQVEACRRVFASDTRWTVVRGSDLEEGESQGLPVWSRHVGDPILESNKTRRVDFALFMVAALENDELVHEAPAIVGCQTPSALAHAARPADANQPSSQFPTDPAGLPECGRPEVVELSDGDEFDLRIGPVAKRLGDATVRMLAYNGSIPGPTLKVPEGSEVVVNVTNDGDLEATVHWHGLRVENPYDGTHQTQTPMPVGGSFTYRIQFPDPGVYWYHPHIREDYGQELGQYGNILVVPADPDYWPPANREILLTLDDVLLEDGKVAPFNPSETNYVAMGRFGNVLLVAGEPDLSLTAERGEVVRVYLTNTANTRVFKVALPGARMKLVGGDSGRCEREEFVEDVILAPSERVVVDVLFAEPGQVTLEHRTPDRTYPLAAITVSENKAEPSLAHEFEVLRTNADMVAERERIAPYMAAEPDKTLAFIAEMDMGVPEGLVVYACPMHPEVVQADEGTCPKCGMKLLATAAQVTYACPMHPEVVSETPDHCPKCGMKLLPSQLIGTAAGGHDHHAAAPEEQAPMHEHHGDAHGHEAAGGIEWEDDMVEVNRMTTPANMRWKIVDRTTGAENHAIDWRFQVGDQVKIRLVNEMDSDHPMHHPFHIHGAGRFLILSRDGVDDPNLVWKDTVLVRTGETVDILLDVTNPGVWMAHCHIAEHHESGMMFSFHVDPQTEQAR